MLLNNPFEDQDEVEEVERVRVPNTSVPPDKTADLDGLLNEGVPSGTTKVTGDPADFKIKVTKDRIQVFDPIQGLQFGIKYVEVDKKKIPINEGTQRPLRSWTASVADMVADIRNDPAKYVDTIPKEDFDRAVNGNIFGIKKEPSIKARSLPKEGEGKLKNKANKSRSLSQEKFSVSPVGTARFEYEKKPKILLPNRRD